MCRKKATGKTPGLTCTSLLKCVWTVGRNGVTGYGTTYFCWLLAGVVEKVEAGAGIFSKLATDPNRWFNPVKKTLEEVERYLENCLSNQTIMSSNHIGCYINQSVNTTHCISMTADPWTREQPHIDGWLGNNATA